MPNLRCSCGFVHDLSPIPDNGWITVQDKDYESLIEAESNPEAESVFVRKTGIIYECPECQRFLWQKPDREEFVTYVLEKK